MTPQQYTAHLLCMCILASWQWSTEHSSTIALCTNIIRAMYCCLCFLYSLLASKASLHNHTMCRIFLYYNLYILIYLSWTMPYNVLINVDNFEPLLQRQRWLEYTLRIVSQKWICILLVLLFFVFLYRVRHCWLCSNW